MSLQPGDKVKFLHQKGGGTVRRVIRPGLVAVLIDDGFEIPTPENELVKIGGASAAEQYFSEETINKQSIKPKPETKGITESANAKTQEFETNAYYESLPPSARASGLASGIYLSFEPHDQKWFITGNLDVYLINLSDYEVLYSYFHRKPKGGFMCRDYGNIAPMQKVLIDVIKREELEYVADGAIQCIFSAESMPSIWMPVTSIFKIKPTRFLKEDNYRKFNFIPRRAFVYQLAEIAKLKMVWQMDELEKFGEEPEVIEQAREIKPRAFIDRHKTAPREAVVDLHADAILEDHKEVLPEELLNLQIAYFLKCMESAIMENYYKVIFIHGVGNGVLKKAIIEKLREYPNVIWQQAPFARFGMGAIEVMIMRHTGQ